MNSKSSDRQNQALAILAIATAAIGFGLFGSNLDTQISALLKLNLADIGFALIVQVSGSLIASLAYFGVLVTTGNILVREGNITGQDLIRSPLILGPMGWLFVEMLALGWLFIGIGL